MTAGLRKGLTLVGQDYCLSRWIHCSRLPVKDSLTWYLIGWVRCRRTWKICQLGQLAAKDSIGDPAVEVNRVKPVGRITSIDKERLLFISTGNGYDFVCQLFIARPPASDVEVTASNAGKSPKVGRNLSNPVTRVGVKESILLVAAGQRVLVLYNGFHQSFIVTAVLEALSVKSI